MYRAWFQSEAFTTGTCDTEYAEYPKFLYPVPHASIYFALSYNRAPFPLHVASTGRARQRVGCPVVLDPPLLIKARTSHGRYWPTERRAAVLRVRPQTLSEKSYLSHRINITNNLVTKWQIYQQSLIENWSMVLWNSQSHDKSNFVATEAIIFNIMEKRKHSLANIRGSACKCLARLSEPKIKLHRKPRLPRPEHSAVSIEWDRFPTCETKFLQFSIQSIDSHLLQSFYKFTRRRSGPSKH